MKNFVEKSFEPYLAVAFLDLSAGDIPIVPGNDGSPSPELDKKFYDCRVYRQDSAFRPGFQGNVIGPDAAIVPIPGNLCTEITMSCSFEHPEGEFLKEASRVPRQGGRPVIIPVYRSGQNSPAVAPSKGIGDDKGATIHCGKGWMRRHACCYSVNTYIQRHRNAGRPTYHESSGYQSGLPCTIFGSVKKRIRSEGEIIVP